ncbi:response regulator [Sphingomonas trueperi]|uniref:response regulator n=1 Tax=Sphingomonas trueperi TaxID=53317 RepID=UPI000EB57C02
MTMSQEDGLTVLIAEDEPLVRMLAADILGEDGFNVLEAQSATEALDMLAENKVEVLFTDINMPGEIDGLELADIVAVRHPRVGIVVTSGRQHLDDWEVPDAGVYLPKPYDYRTLAETMRHQVKDRR